MPGKEQNARKPLGFGFGLFCGTRGTFTSLYPMAMACDLQNLGMTMAPELQNYELAAQPPKSQWLWASVRCSDSQDMPLFTLHTALPYCDVCIIERLEIGRQK
jgi:hypothetical protein